MRKIFIVVLSIVVVSVFPACNSKKNKSKEIEQYQYSEAKVQLNDALNKKVGSWIKEGEECYGIIMVNSPDGIIQAVKEVKATVLIIQSDKIKMKALEDVSLAPKVGCTKMGIAKGDTWWEEDGDLFKTREEAIQFAKTIMQKKSPAGAKFTI